jgi:hypothetical protein
LQRSGDLVAAAIHASDPDESPVYGGSRVKRGGMDQVWPLLGREAQLRVAEGCFHRAEVVGVLFVGAAGVGKTRLARELLAALAAPDRRTLWVSGSRSAASVPFGAVAHLLPPEWSAGGERVAALRAVVDRVAACGGRGRTVVCVDDAHLLDGGSATVVSQVAEQGAAFVVLTADEAAPLPDALAALWRNGTVLRVAVPPLPATAVDELLDQTFAGHLDGLTRKWLHDGAAGNPLLLRELIQAGLDSGTLRQRHGVWRQHGELAVTPRLTQLLAQRLAEVDSVVYAMLEVVACAEPVSMQLVERLADRAALEAAERAGLVSVHRADHGPVLRLPHSLYAAAIRAALPVSRATMIWQRLVEAIAEQPARSDNDLLRAGQWQLAAGTVVAPDLLLPAAEVASERFDLDLAERLVRLARATVPTWQADRMLADILELRGRSDEAAEVLPPGPGDRGPDRLEWALTTAMVCYWGGGDATRAEAALDFAPTEPGYDLAEAARSWICLFDGRCDAAVAAARRVVELPGARDEAVVLAVRSGAGAAGLLGRPDEVAALAEEGMTATRAIGDSIPWTVGQVRYGHCMGLLGVGELRQAEALADEGYRVAVAGAHAPPMVGGWAALRGLVALARGRAVPAVRLLKEAVVLLEEEDTYRSVRSTLTALAAASALSGDADAASGWLARAEAAPAVSRLLRAWEELDRAWVVTAIGDLSRACALALSAAQLASATGQPTFEGRALYDAARLGAARAAHPRLVELAGEVRGPLIPRSPPRPEPWPPPIRSRWGAPRPPSTSSATTCWPPRSAPPPRASTGGRAGRRRRPSWPSG